MGEGRGLLMPTPEEPLLAPWKLNPIAAVGGLLAVGYAPGTDLLLVGSHDGLGVFDCLTGERLLRDNAAEGYPATATLELEGIGPLAGLRIRTAGLLGGGLPLGTEEGTFHLDIQPAVFAGDFAPYRGKPCWEVRLDDTTSWVGHETRYARTCLIYHGFSLRAAGFSETGKSFVVAESHSLHMFVREDRL